MSASTSNASSISLILNQQISYAVYHLPAGTYHLPEDSGKLSQELLIGLGLIERTSAPPTVPPPPAPPPPQPSSTDTDADAKSDAKSDAKARTRTVSKKMKDAFLASPGNTRTEDDLKRVSKAYKAATDADIAAAGGDFVSFGNRILAAPATPASAAPKEDKTDKDKDKTKTKAVKPKVEKPKPRLAWSAAEKKVFKDIVTDVTDDLKAEFAAYIDAKSDDDFKAFAMAGHMRAWFDARVTITPKAGNGEFTPAEYDLARGVQNSGVQDDDEDEDLVDIDVDGEQLLIGTKTGTIYQPTEEAGDVKIGRAGEGKFKNVKIPQE